MKEKSILWFKTTKSSGVCKVTLPNDYLSFFIKELKEMNGEVIAKIPEVRKINFIHNMKPFESQSGKKIKRFTAGWRINDAENTIELAFSVVNDKDKHYVKKEGRTRVIERLDGKVPGFYFKLNIQSIFGQELFKPNNSVKVSDVDTKVINSMVFNVVASQSQKITQW